jgi:quercetin dioxygenase-like cupin family protein
MTRYLAAAVAALAVLTGRPVAGQTPAPEADPGVRPTRLIDRAEVRVSRVEIQAGATRRVHAHDDVEYHMWIPIEGALELTIKSDPPVVAKPGQAYFMTRGTPHGFKNVGATPAAVFEIFIKQTMTAAGADVAAAVALEPAALGVSTPPVR